MKEKMEEEEEEREREREREKEIFDGRPRNCASCLHANLTMTPPEDEDERGRSREKKNGSAEKKHPSQRHLLRRREGSEESTRASLINSRMPQVAMEKKVTKCPGNSREFSTYNSRGNESEEPR